MRVVRDCALGLALAAAVCGQAPDRGAIGGLVTDASGAGIPGVRVRAANRATGFARQAQGDGEGRYSVVELPLTGGYRLEFSAEGFAPQVLDDIELRAGVAAVVNVKLALAGGRSAITVEGAVDGIRPNSAQLGTRVDAATIDNTPILGRKLTALPLLNSAVRPARGTGDLFLGENLFVVNGAGRRQTSYVIDGASADDAWGRQTIFTSVPLTAMQEMTVLTNPSSAQYGWSAGSVVNVNTRSGTNEWHGEALGLWRPGGMEANVPLATQPTPDRLGQGSGMLAGPLARDRTHFLVSAESSLQTRDSQVTSPLGPGMYQGRYRQDLLFGRLDQRFNDRHTSSVRLDLDGASDSNPADAVGGLTLPSAARRFRRNTYSAQLEETAVLGPATLNEARAVFQLGSPITQFDPVAPGTQFVRPGVGTEGESRSANLTNRQWQMADGMTLVRGAHNLKMGGDALYSASGGMGQEFGGGYVLGQFTLTPGNRKPAAQLTPADVQRYVQSFGNASYRVTEWLGDGYFADSIRWRPGLTVDLGLRYDRQDFSDDTLDFAPRVGFAWNPGSASRTVMRGGVGLYYSQLRANTAATYFINGPTGIFSFSAAPGQYGFPSSLAPLAGFPSGAALPPRDIYIRPGERAFLSQFFDVSKLRGYPDRLLNPRTEHVSIGVERELAPHWVLAADYVHQYTTRIDRPLDLNAPAPLARTQAGQVRSAATADLTRPIVPVPNGYRRIIAVVNDGMARYDGLQASLTHRFSGGFSLLASYTLSHAVNSVEPDVPQQDPNDATVLGRAERATSVLDQRHRVVLSGWWQWRRYWSFGGVSSLASGRPYNITTGVDNNGDGSFADRPVAGGALMGRNSGRGTPVYDVSPFVDREIRLPGERGRINLRAEAFNLLNHSNIVGRNGTWGNGDMPQPGLGQALGGINNVDPGREFQFELRMTF